ncbi:Heterokaryon incompatibility [Beauveria bassiana ARSEF 2860]|uniref:Heterokaryon incompatibility n=1 Tax=Beauveria bassiana (strain ARSEF 2860) TaxID=655819 RepID=J4KQU9_BEAB2|nr:Heterokaryon incompatibility [Beauveria bassiana ARSEF 2860]EJP69834.1 Heterokaryon incompatibility [Beauveria bassiana ARSEF 2860]
MRLLEIDGAGGVRLTGEWIAPNIPPYAALSHTWGRATDEVSFADMGAGRGTNKPGYEKIRFCAKQAFADGLRYCWVDTCCIDKSNSTELAEAINSMFLWYQHASRCYVYLADVSIPALRPNHIYNAKFLEDSLRLSRWFTRGWTLQELVAPISVEFFSKESQRLGSKLELEHCVAKITGIPFMALRNLPLSEFTIDERMQWAQSRVTTRPEDAAYSLMGIFDVYMALLYGEGRDNAFKRLREEIEKAHKGTHA